MAALFQEGYRYRESDPERQLSYYTRCRDEARRLHEPWWELFFEHWRLSALTSDIGDFARALPLAMELLVRFTAPDAAAHPDAPMVQTDVLFSHAQVDPIGFADLLDKGFAALERQIGAGSLSTRLVFDYRWIQYLADVERLEEAHQRLQEHMARLDGCDPGTLAWHRCWALFLACHVYDGMNQLDDVAGYAREMAELSEKGEHLMRTRASGWLWTAVCQRATGLANDAARSFRRGMRYLETLSVRDEICADSVARYYEVGNQWNAALGTRERELAAVASKGTLHRHCVLMIERCKLLSRAGTLTDADLLRARQCADRMRKPDWYLQKLAAIQRHN
ncbi:MAG TPA: hypothetical protein VHM90_04475 [Phycisphaerae bacterium]|nr:hypothetical protein [Phycisphaerae bacterium]